MLSAHENPAFQAMCREHEIEGTAMVALCGVFWDRALATHAAAAAKPLTDEQIAAAVRPLYANDTAASMALQDDIRITRLVQAAALTSAPAEPDAYNRRLRAQLEQEWADLQRLKNAYTPTGTPPAGDELIFKLECFIDHATGGKLSKSSWALETLKAAHDEYVKAREDAAVAEVAEPPPAAGAIDARGQEEKS